MAKDSTVDVFETVKRLVKQMREYKAEYSGVYDDREYKNKAGVAALALIELILGDDLCRAIYEKEGGPF